MSQVAGKGRTQSREMTYQKLVNACGTNSQAMARYGICPVDWAVVTGHALADSARVPRDDQAWVADATARYRMAWRACADDSLVQWQAYLRQVPPPLLAGRLKRIAAPADPFMACQFRVLRRLHSNYGDTGKSYLDAKTQAWCAKQMGLLSMVPAMKPPMVFTPQVLNDSGSHVSWLYDTTKADQRPREWKFSECMTQVAQQLAAQGFNLPNPPGLDKFCLAGNRRDATDYLSGKARADGLAKLGPEPN
jgi:hypothetical protein